MSCRRSITVATKAGANVVVAHITSVLITIAIMGLFLIIVINIPTPYVYNHILKYIDSLVNMYGVLIGKYWYFTHI